MNSLNKSIVTLLRQNGVQEDFILNYQNALDVNEDSVDVIKDYWIRLLLNISGNNNHVISTCMYLRDCSSSNLFMTTFQDDVVRIVIKELGRGNKLI